MRLYDVAGERCGLTLRGPRRTQRACSDPTGPKGREASHGARATLEERLWTEAELADRYSLSPATLRTWRSRGLGPRFIKVGHRALYPESHVARWEANPRRTPSPA